MKTALASLISVVLLVVGLGAGYLGGVSNAPITTTTSTATRTETSSTTTTATTTVTTPVTTTATQSVTQTLTQSVTSTVQAQIKTVNIVVVPDFGGNGYDAFVNAGNLNATTPKLATNTTKPGPNNNDITVPAGVPIKFVITNIDTALVANFTGTVAVPFSLYNDTSNGQVGVQYQPGQKITKMAISHTFSITALNMHIPIPPDTIVVFTFTFSKAGVYSYFCETPCGPGMTTPQYMSGNIIVT